MKANSDPNRNAPFEFIAKRVRQHARMLQPAISVDTTKKEVLGNRENSGRVLNLAKPPVCVETHDFLKKKLGNAVPYGVHDLQNNEAFVCVGISHDTAQFAGAVIER